MKHPRVFTILFCSFFLFSYGKGKDISIKEIKIKAPGAMSWIKVPDFRECKRLLITNFGAVQGNKAKTSEVIYRAIHEANAMGGATVVVPD